MIVRRYQRSFADAHVTSTSAVISETKSEYSPSSTPAIRSNYTMTQSTTGLAAADGYHMPGEWGPHARIWMGWPQRPDNWRDKAKPAQAAFVQVATAISRFTPVTICANASQASTMPFISVLQLSRGLCLW